MNSYTIDFKHYKKTVEASNSEQAIMIAAVCADEVIDVEDRGELYSVTMHTKCGDEVFWSAAGLQSEADKGAQVTSQYDRLPIVDELPIEMKSSKLPSRREAGLTLVYDEGDLAVVSFAYSASLARASDSGELWYDGRGLDREPKVLNERQQAVVDTWMEREADYYAVNGWATWSEINE